MRSILCLISFVIILLLGSCKPGVPREYIQPKTMQNILYEYHIALGMAQEQYQIDDERRINEQAYKLAILDKYGVSEEKFEKSMEYYMRHTKELHDIYEKISQRLEREAVAQGVTEGELSQYDSNVAQGDTADIWRADRAFVLMKQAPYNHYSFVIKADTSFYKGDRLTLMFNTQYLAQDGSRDAVVVIAMRLNNDSIVTKYQHMMTNSRQTVTLNDGKRQGIKEIRGYFMLVPEAEKSSTMKLLFISNIKMTRVHEKETTTEKENSEDSVSVAEPHHKRDSLKKDSLPRRKFNIHETNSSTSPDDRRPFRRRDGGR